MKDKGKLSFFERLVAIFSGGYSIEGTPLIPVEEGETVVGVLQNPVLQGVFKAVCDIADSVEAEDDEHTNKYHGENPEAHSDQECQSFYNSLTCRLQGADSLNNLIAIGLAVEFPMLAEKNIATGIREGWQVIISEGPESRQPSEADKDFTRREIKQFMETLRQIFTGTLKPQLVGENISIARVREGEKVLGTLSDTRLQALYEFCDRLYKRTSGEVENEIVASVLSTMYELSYQLLWFSISGLPEFASSVGNLAMRDNWQIVEAPRRVVIKGVLIVGMSGN